MDKKSSSKILILTKCSEKIGTGHLKRSLQLQRSLLREKFNCEIWTNKDLEINKILNSLNYKSKIKCFKKIPLKINDYKKFRLVVIDIAWNDPWLNFNKKSITKLIEKMEMLNIRVVNIGKPKLETSLFRSFIDIYPDGSNVKVSGNVSPRFIALRKQFYLARPKNNKLFRGTIFLTMGGTDPLNMLKKALEQIVDCKHINHVIILIGSNSDIDTQSISEFLSKGKKKSTFLKNVGAKKIIDSMQKSDIAVTAFGTTAFESMALRLPVIAVTHYKHQDNSAKWFSDLRSIEYLGCAEKGIKWSDLKYKINYLYYNQKIARNMAIRANSFIDGKGNERITNLLKEIYKETFFNLDDLFIFAHPGTEALVAAGVITKLVKNGKKVGIVVMGDGISSRIKSSLKKKNSSELHTNLEKSFEDSCIALGIKVKYFYRYQDNQFDKEPLLSFVKNIENILKRHKPNRIWTHEESGLNIDHKVINKAVMIASRPVVGSKISTIFGFKTPGSVDWSFSNLGITADNWYEEVDLKSQRRLRSYNSYNKINYFNHSLHSLGHVESQLRSNGKKIGVTAAEAFCLIRNLGRMS
jgi:spore coat polysaccharide biosynthesis predicted glycosyltransferase SpsG